MEMPSIHFPVLLSKANKTVRIFTVRAVNGPLMARRILVLFAVLVAAGALFKMFAMNTAAYRTLAPATIHSTPDEEGLVTGDLSAGHALTVLSEKGTWLKVKAQAGQKIIQGYVKRDRTNF